MTTEQKVSTFQWVRFAAGLVILAAVVAAHLFVKPFSDLAFVALLAIPGALIGVDVKGMFGGSK